MTAQSPLEPEVIDQRPGHRSGGVRLELDTAQLQFLAKLMDSAFQIPGVPVRFGFDAILGLIPGLGDFATSFVTLFILQEAQRRGVPKITLARMGFNVLVDWTAGTVPVLGDAFDVYWKSNQKNIDLLLRHEADLTLGKQRNWGDWLFLCGLIAILLAVLVGSLSLSFFLASAAWSWMTSGATK